MNNENWMSNYQNKSIMDLIIPGSHDSFALKFKSCSPNDLNLPKICNPIIKLWAKTQNNTILEQLNMGIRYFDIRVEEYNNTYYTVHSLLSLKLIDVLNDILNFVRNHNTEKIIIDINHLYNINDYTHLKNVLIDILNDYLINYDIYNLSKPLNNIQGNIFLFYGNYNSNKIFPNYLINSIWHDTNDINILCNNIRNEQLQPNKLNVCQILLTIRTSDIVKSILLPLFYPISLKSLTNKYRNEMYNLLNDVVINKNIIIKDFIDDEFINICINSNSNK